MALVARFIAAAAVFIAVFLFSYWIVFVQVFSFDVAYAPALLTAAATAFATWRVMGPGHRGIATTAFRWAAIAGGVGFCLGFFGPMALDPGGNQGPMLGLFITGPLGFLAGGICGLIYAVRRRSGTANAS